MPSPPPYDALIIGAGFSGLQCAHSLVSSSPSSTPSIILLEAKPRVGGKSLSAPRPDGRGVQEMGACWVNDSNQALVWEWCRRLGLTAVVQNVEGNVAWEGEGEEGDGGRGFFAFGGWPQFDPSEIENITALRDGVEAASLDPASFTQPRRRQLDDMTFEQFCRSLGAGQKALLTARVWCRGTTGQDPSDVSALAFLEIARGGLGIVNLRYDGKDGAQYLRLREGTSAIATGMAGLLPKEAIRLGTPVSAVTKKEDGCFDVTTRGGEVFVTKKVIVSVPSNTYKDITFDPPLPPWKQAHASATRYGTYVKYICLFKTPWWRKLGACGLVQSFRGPINHSRDTSVDQDENYALTCFITSGPARRWLAMGDGERRDAVVSQLARLFGVEKSMVEEELLDKMESQWHLDEYTGWGCPFTLPPPGGIIGEGGDGEVVNKAADGLIFIGTELTDQWRGYMEGALLSGKRGAKQAGAA